MSTDDQLSIEDRVRAATRAGASLISDVRPLGAPAPVRLRPRPERPARRRVRWVSWGIPLAAAAAAAAVVLALVALHQPGAPSGPATRPATTAVPRYYAALGAQAAGGSHGGPLIVGDDRTGKVIATVAPPPGLVFAAVRGASDDRTFVVTAGAETAHGTAPYTWYLLRIAPGAAHPYTLTRLPVQLPASSPNAVSAALSPDGGELAVESLGSGSTTRAPTSVTLYSVSSGVVLHSWSTPANLKSGLSGSPLSWLSDGQRIVFGVGRFTVGQAFSLQLRALALTNPGSDLLAASTPLLSVDSPANLAASCASLTITPDGRTAVCAIQYDFLTSSGSNAGCASGALGFTAYSVRTGQPDDALYQYRGACHNGVSALLWTNASASTVIGAIEVNVANEGGKQAAQVGVITGGQFHPLRIAPSVRPEDYGSLAF